MLKVTHVEGRWPHTASAPFKSEDIVTRVQSYPESGTATISLMSRPNPEVWINIVVKGSRFQIQSTLSIPPPSEN